MKITFDRLKILNNINILFSNDNNCLAYLERLIDELESHNKNYTKEQYFKILQAQEIIKNIKIEEVK